MSATIEALEDMKQVLFEHGWIQKSFHEANGFCLMGSYTRSGLQEKYNLKICASVMNALRRASGDNIFPFNNAKDRTFGEVIDVIDAAILNEKERGR